MRHEFEAGKEYNVAAYCYCQPEPIFSSPEGAPPDEVMLDHEPMAEEISKDHERLFNHVIYIVHQGPHYQTVV